jgi:hypothetical protein
MTGASAGPSSPAEWNREVSVDYSAGNLSKELPRRLLDGISGVFTKLATKRRTKIVLHSTSSRARAQFHMESLNEAGINVRTASAPITRSERAPVSAVHRPQSACEFR